MRNPFKYGCVVSGEYFCARKALEKQIRSYAESGQNVVIQGSRRMGKSSLVRKTLVGLKGWRTIFIDLYYIGTVGDFCRRVMDGVAKSNDSLSFLRKAMGIVTRLRPTLSFDTTNGAPVISIDSRAANEPDSLTAVMGLLEKISKEGKVAVVFDEFQDVLRLGEPWKILAEMRASIQLQQHAPYFFLGSVRNDMMSIFTSSKSPFFKSAAPLEVEQIDSAEFMSFIQGRFEKGNRRIESSVIQTIMERADFVSGDVQELCSAIWDSTEDGATIGNGDIDSAMRLVFQNERKGFERAISGLTPTQVSVLKGIASLPQVGVYTAEFLQNIGIASTGTVTKAVKHLIADDLVYSVEKGLKFVDPFFREWLLANR